MIDLLTWLAFVAVLVLALGFGWLAGYGSGIATGLRDAAKSARYEAGLMRRDNPSLARTLTRFADRQEKRADTYRKHRPHPTAHGTTEPQEVESSE